MSRVAPVFAQESVQSAKDLYASAAYEDALAVLTRLRVGHATAEVDQYRAFCLIALGREEEAEKAIESAVAADPRYVPTAFDVSPRIQDAFNRARKRLIPDLARQLYAEGRRAQLANNTAAAERAFAGVVDLVDTAGANAEESLQELRLLAQGFLDLINAKKSATATRPENVAPTDSAVGEPAPSAGARSPGAPAPVTTGWVGVISS